MPHAHAARILHLIFHQIPAPPLFRSINSSSVNLVLTPVLLLDSRVPELDVLASDVYNRQKKSAEKNRRCLDVPSLFRTNYGMIFWPKTGSPRITIGQDSCDNKNKSKKNCVGNKNGGRDTWLYMQRRMCKRTGRRGEFTFRLAKRACARANGLVRAWAWIWV
ncbi:hypothetical protein DFH08DRAFT_824011 [Mycena albidolilacea]|uniref:Uncharacterized protein n=1 Tax=Mycena albidolilacea TaxID=1033008 RepID=A0AAD6Z547_9AGAR|nr:hypothetical protein DFH08DRAFT_824011 [Mycena albidolilacea]